MSKEARKLLDKKYSNSKKLFLIEGENLVEEALNKGIVKEIITLDGINRVKPYYTIFIQKRIIY